MYKYDLEMIDMKKFFNDYLIQCPPVEKFLTDKYINFA